MSRVLSIHLPAVLVCLLAVAAPAALATEGERPAPAEARQIQAMEPGRAAPLDRWRRIQDQAKEAMRAPTAEERVEALEAFLEAHPNHLAIEKPLETLVKSYVELEAFDADRVAALVERLAAEDEDSWYTPIRLVRTYHIEHELPVASADRLLAEARRRIAEEREEKKETEDDENALERALARLEYYEAQTSSTAAKLRLVHGDAESAAPLLDMAAETVEEQPRGIFVRNEEGEVELSLESGLFDGLHLMRSLTALRLGDEKAAKRHFSALRVVGSDPLQREWADEIRAGLSLAKPEALEALGEPLDAQPFTLEDMDGETVSLEDYKGKVVLVAFWATWCGPCRQELPVLQKFAREHAEDGVELVGVSIDRFEDRAQIPAFMEDNNLDFRVLLEDEEQLTEYNYRGIPALYVIDRDGKIADARTGYDPKFKEKLEGKILAIAKGEPTPGRVLLRVEKAPAGFGVLWQTPVSGSAEVVTIAPPLAGQPGEVAIVSRNQLERFGPAGAELGAKPIRDARWVQGLRAADLDASGTREWIVGDYRDVMVLDSEGERYWSHTGDARVTLVDVREPGPSGDAEIVVKEGSKVVALGHMPEEKWSSEEIEDLQRVTPAPGGGVLVQTEDEFFELGPDGKPRGEKRALPEGLFFAGRMERPDGGYRDVFEGRYDTTPILDWDVDGDGARDIVLARSNSVVAFNGQGEELLRIDGEDNRFAVTMGDLDGNPGDELALFVQHYGLVVLGRETQRASR